MTCGDLLEVLRAKADLCKEQREAGHYYPQAPDGGDRCGQCDLHDYCGDGSTPSGEPDPAFLEWIHLRRHHGNEKRQGRRG